VAVLTSAARDALPDSAFACVEGSGDSKVRRYPHHHADGSLDLPHLRNALSRLAQEATSSCGADHLRKHAAAENIGEKDLHSHETLAHDAQVPEVKSFPLVDFELKDDGEVVVAFSRIGEIDHDKDVTYKGAIPSKTVPMSDYGHTSWPQRGARLPVGKGLIGEDGDLGIFRGGFFLKTTPGRDAYETVKAMGDEQEWSYGFDVIDFEPKPKAHPGAKRGLKSLDIHEISPVLLGAGIGTGTLAIKGLDEDLLVGSFTEQSDRVLAALKELQTREEDIIVLRLKEGRAISSARRAKLAEQRDLLSDLLAGVTSLLSVTEPKPKEGDGTEQPAGDPLGKSRLLAAQAKLREEITRRGYREALPV
jgi:hypothetical protein